MCDCLPCGQSLAAPNPWGPRFVRAFSTTPLPLQQLRWKRSALLLDRLSRGLPCVNCTRRNGHGHPVHGLQWNGTLLPWPCRTTQSAFSWSMPSTGSSVHPVNGSRSQRLVHSAGLLLTWHLGLEGCMTQRASRVYERTAEATVPAQPLRAQYGRCLPCASSPRSQLGPERSEQRSQPGTGSARSSG
jgi:hypothetical protein